jgi:hypothetical protein
LSLPQKFISILIYNMQLVAKEHGCLGSSGGNTTGRFENPFVTIPSAYQTLDSFMRVNGLVHTESGVIPCYETNGESMDIYIVCE